jgi:hypothetical protein
MNDYYWYNARKVSLHVFATCRTMRDVNPGNWDTIRAPFLLPMTSVQFHFSRRLVKATLTEMMTVDPAGAANV